jgi:LytS/YehU family sensor histidine kinase
MASIAVVVTIVLLRVNLLGMTHRSVTYTYFIRSVPAFGFYLITTVIWFFANMISAQRNEIELRNSQLASELKFLKLQLSPHFLFNTLNNIYSMAYFKEENTAPAIMKLSEMMRHMLYEDQGRFVSLAKEINFMENFIELWRLKLDEKPTIAFSHDGAKGRHRITHLIFLVFLENAFKHGNTMDGRIAIKLTINKEDVLHFYIRNDVLKARKTAEEESGVGLSNVKKRLNLIYPGKHELVLDQTTGSFEVNVNIDLK